MSEDQFPPRPGGMVDTVRRQRQAEQDQARSLGDVTAAPAPGDYPAVRVRIAQPDLATARTITLSAANPVAPLVPRDDQRRAATVIAVDNDVWISANEGTAADLAGTSGAGSAFYLPAGIGFPFDTRAQLWVSPTTLETSSRVAVMITRDSTL